MKNSQKAMHGLTHEFSHAAGQVIILYLKDLLSMEPWVGDRKALS